MKQASFARVFAPARSPALATLSWSVDCIPRRRSSSSGDRAARRAANDNRRRRNHPAAMRAARTKSLPQRGAVMRHSAACSSRIVKAFRAAHRNGSRPTDSGSWCVHCTTAVAARKSGVAARPARPDRPLLPPDKKDCTAGLCAAMATPAL